MALGKNVQTTHNSICLAIANDWLSAKSRPPQLAFLDWSALQNEMDQPLTTMFPRRRKNTSEYRMKLKSADKNIYINLDSDDFISAIP